MGKLDENELKIRLHEQCQCNMYKNYNVLSYCIWSFKNKILYYFKGFAVVYLDVYVLFS